MPRIGWTELPSAVHRAVEAHAGPVVGVEPVADGITCRMAAVLTTASGRVFVKGVPGDDDRGVAAQAVEAAINPALSSVAPRLVAQVLAGGWDLLVFEHAPGRHADLSPGSPDLPGVADALDIASETPAPGWLPPLADRYAPFLDAGQAALLDGGTLLHTDTNPHNLLAAGGVVTLVDWAMAARGPAWVDVAFTAVRLMEDGHTAADALRWAAGCPAWQEADPTAVEALVAGVCREWEARVGTRSAVASNTRYGALLDATRATPTA